MAVLPDDTALGPLSSANSGRPIASYDVSGLARGAAAIGGGASDLGKGVSSAAKDVLAVQDHQQKQIANLQKVQADAAASSGLITLNAAREDEDDVEKLKTFPALHSQMLDNAARFISDPTQRQLWVTQNSATIAAQEVATKNRIFDVQQDQAFAGAKTQLFDLQQKGAVAKTDPEREVVVRSAHNLIDGLENAGYITAEDAVKRRLEFANGYAVTSFNSLPADQRLAIVREAPQGREAILDRFGGIENSSGDPAARSGTSTAQGDFQFIDSTWLNTIKAHRPDLMQGRDPQTLLDLRADPKLSREMAGYLMDDNAAALKSAGVDATPGNLYLAHFLGAGDAAKVLKAPSGTPVADLLSPQVIAANASVLAGKTTGTVQAWSDQKMGGGDPNAQGAALLKFMTPDQIVEIKQKAANDWNATIIDQKKVAAVQQQQAQQQSDAAEFAIFKDVHSDVPKYSAQDILDNPKLTKDAAVRMFNLKASLTGMEKADKTYGPGFYEAYQRVHAADGDPNKITDPSQLYPRAGPKGDLTVAGVDKLVNEIQSRKSPEGVAESEMKSQFLKNARAQISGTDEGLHTKDPKGDELYLKWLAHALPDYDAARKAGKSPQELLNPDSPAYVGKSITQFKRPNSEWFKDVMQDSPVHKDPEPSLISKVVSAFTPSPAFDPKTVKSLDDLVSAYRGGKVTKAIADQLAIDKGWAMRTPAASLDLVPVSQ